MLLLIIGITALFISISFFYYLPVEKTTNLFLVYFSTELSSIVRYLLFFLLGFLGITLLHYTKYFEKQHPFHKKLIHASIQSIQVLTLGFLLAYVLLFCIAFFELNIFAFLMNLNPKILGIENDVPSIVRNLTTNNHPPIIISADNDPSKEVTAIATAASGNDNLYGKYILSSIPSFLILPIKKQSASMLLIDNTLIITAIDSHDMERVSPVIGYLFIKQYFWGRLIKSYPKVAIMNNTEYVSYRQRNFLKKLAAIDVTIQKLDENISSLSAEIQTTKDTLANSNILFQQQVSQKDNEYKQCLGSQYSITDCKNLRSQWENTISKTTENANSLNDLLAFGTKQLATYTAYDTFFKNLKKIIQVSKGNIPFELGVFEPKDSIKIVLNTNNAHTIADFFATVTHEYLHYVSYISEQQKLTDIFFEEGLTEYFARQTIKDQLNTSTNLGYPVFVKIISAMTNRIAESDLADIYFTKNEKGLETLLDRVYGDNFYKDNQILFETLQYTSEPQQVLKTANEIMTKIGGTLLTEKDLMSSYSNF